MEVTFLRHGIAVDRDDPVAPSDFSRPLTIDGKHKLEASLRGLKGLSVRPELIVTSPYLRCVQTATLAAKALDLSKRTIQERETLLPGAAPADFWTDLMSVVPRERVLVVGHGDTLEPIAGYALGFPVDTAEPGISTLALRVLHLKKGGALQLSLPSLADPSAFAARPAELVWLAPPRLLRQIGRA